jgi:ABC-type oligopeptide transport system ATPase subunit
LDTIIEVKNLSKTYEVNSIFSSDTIKAVDDVSFKISKGDTLGLIGESGCGKSTLGCLILKLIKRTQGNIIFKGKDISDLSEKAMRPLRREIQMIFQNNLEFLDPKMTVERLLLEPLKLHNIVGKEDYSKEIIKLLHYVGMSSYDKYKFPSQLSGGQKQRIGIARAIATKPSLIICDEPISALDVSVQSQILNLLMNLKAEFNLTYIFISHDLKAVKYVSNIMAVMYKGKLIEFGSKEEVLNNSNEEYTKNLISSILY